MFSEGVFLFIVTLYLMMYAAIRTPTLWTMSPKTWINAARTLMFCFSEAKLPLLEMRLVETVSNFPLWLWLVSWEWPPPPWLWLCPIPVWWRIIPSLIQKKKNCFNPLTSSSDWHLISPNHVNPESNKKVRRMKELISDKRSSWLLDKFSLSAP